MLKHTAIALLLMAALAPGAALAEGKSAREARQSVSKVRSQAGEVVAVHASRRTVQIGSTVYKVPGTAAIRVPPSENALTMSSLAVGQTVTVSFDDDGKVVRIDVDRAF